MEREYVSQKFVGTLLGMAIGDAMGLPSNGLCPYLSYKKYQQIDDFYPSTGNPPGTYSIHTKYALNIAKSIKEKISIDKESLLAAQTHVSQKAPDSDETKSSIIKIAALPYEKCGSANSLSPSFLLKMIPVGMLAAVKGYDELDLLKQCRDVCILTHGYRPSWLAGYVVAKIVRDAIRSSQELRNPYEWYQSDMSIFAKIINSVRQFETTMKGDEILADNLSGRLSFIRRKLQQGVDVDSIVGLCGNSGHAFVDVSFAVFCFMRSPDSFNAMVDSASMGGDSSINTALVGAFVGAYAGQNAIKESLRFDVKNKINITELGEQMMENLYTE